MSKPVSRSAGMMVVRVWVEGDGTLRARITIPEHFDQTLGFSKVVLGEERVLEEVRSWLQSFRAEVDR